MAAAKPLVLKLPPDHVLASLFEQAVVNRVKGEHFSKGLRAYSELLLYELQDQIYATAHRRAERAERAKKEREARPPALERPGRTGREDGLG